MHSSHNLCKELLNSVKTITFVLVFSLQMPNVIEEEAVRIYVEFDRIDSAIKGTRIVPSLS